MFRKLCPREELWMGEIRACAMAGRALVLVDCDGEVSAFADRCAHQGVPIDDVMRAFRVGYTVLWEGLSEIAADLGQDYAQALLQQADPAAVSEHADSGGHQNQPQRMSLQPGRRPCSRTATS